MKITAALNDELNSTATAATLTTLCARTSFAAFASRAPGATSTAAATGRGPRTAGSSAATATTAAGGSTSTAATATAGSGTATAVTPVESVKLCRVRKEGTSIGPVAPDKSIQACAADGSIQAGLCRIPAPPDRTSSDTAGAATTPGAPT